MGRPRPLRAPAGHPARPAARHHCPRFPPVGVLLGCAQGQAARRTLDDATAESLLRKALHVNSWIFCDDEDGRIRQELSELLRRQVRLACVCTGPWIVETEEAVLNRSSVLARRAGPEAGGARGPRRAHQLFRGRPRRAATAAARQNVTRVFSEAHRHKLTLGNAPAPAPGFSISRSALFARISRLRFLSLRAFARRGVHGRSACSTAEASAAGYCTFVRTLRCKMAMMQQQLSSRRSAPQAAGATHAAPPPRALVVAHCGARGLAPGVKVVVAPFQAAGAHPCGRVSVRPSAGAKKGFGKVSDKKVVGDPAQPCPCGSGKLHAVSVEARGRRRTRCHTCGRPAQ